MSSWHECATEMGRGELWGSGLLGKESTRSISRGRKGWRRACPVLLMWVGWQRECLQLLR